ncbi:hypothetical protein EV356DRAFT_514437 [Viridothelium virens]|uniref:SET domain-containing protein n=1 Tax=Viridothelium virens TaxID=1048519 RepID=A0A6A6HB70_VIRVR|nr:hypothetical protein EV356DRAFT_514437 [Viridothelium virens]
MASKNMVRTNSNASDSDESNCITVVPLQEDNGSSTTLTDRVPKQRSEPKPKAIAPKRTTSMRRTSRFKEEDTNGTGKQIGTASPARNVSGQTLVEGAAGRSPNITQKNVHKLGLDWTVDTMPRDTLGKISAKKSIKSNRTARLNKAAKAAANAVTSAASVLGKRGRDVLETGKEKIERLRNTHSASLRPRVSSTPSNEGLDHAAKRIKTDNSTGFREPATWQLNDRNKQRKIVHRYLKQGLYAGQDRYFDPRFSEKKNKKRSTTKAIVMPAKENKTLPMPMFAGERLLENGRDFKLPFFVCNPLMSGPPKADEWKKVKRNRFVGDAADHWRKHKLLACSLCMCTPEEGCGENCHNVMMYYECDASNCNVGPEHCRNRNFADLKDRVRKGGKFNIGVDVMMTANRGWGVRANRTFRPNQIIMEYAGEIITQDECENRMRNEYKDNKCYYLMEFEQGMIIDATRGSMARFVNHSCEPNCRMEQWKVNGEPRMALFAGDDGILVGEELTYDYNFDPFSSQNVQECHCGAPSCRGVLGPRTRDAPKPKKGSAGITNPSTTTSTTRTSGSKRKMPASSLKRTATAAAAAANSSLDTEDFDLDSSSISPPAKKAKTLKDAARSAFATTKSNLANALQAAETSRRLQRQKQQEKADKENDARAARLARRRSGGGDHGDDAGSNGGDVNGGDANDGDANGGAGGDVVSSSPRAARSASLSSSSSSSSAIETQALLTKKSSGSSLAVAVSASARRSKSGSESGAKQRRHTLATTTAATAVKTKNILGRTAQTVKRRADSVTKVVEKKQKVTVAKQQAGKGSRGGVVKSASSRRAAQRKNSLARAVEADDGFGGLADGLPSSSMSSSSSASLSTKDGKSEPSSSSSLPAEDMPAAKELNSYSLAVDAVAERYLHPDDFAWLKNLVASLGPVDAQQPKEKSTGEQEDGKETGPAFENNAFERLFAGSKRAEMKRKEKKGKKKAKAVQPGA